jgi:hypothetical protein
VELINNFCHIVNSSDVELYRYGMYITKVLRPRKRRQEDFGQNGDAEELQKQLQQQEQAVETTTSLVQKSSVSVPVPVVIEPDVKLAQDRFIRKFADEILEHFAKKNVGIFERVPYVNYGSKEVYTTKPLQFPYGATSMDATFEMDTEGRPTYFRIVLKLVERVSLRKADDYYRGNRTKGIPISGRILTLYEILFRAVLGEPYILQQCKFFYLDHGGQKSHDVRMWNFVQGFIASIRLTEFGLTTNVSRKS